MKFCKILRRNLVALKKKSILFSMNIHFSNAAVHQYETGEQMPHVSTTNALSIKKHNHLNVNFWKSSPLVSVDVQHCLSIINIQQISHRFVFVCKQFGVLLSFATDMNQLDQVKELLPKKKCKSRERKSCLLSDRQTIIIFNIQLDSINTLSVCGTIFFVDKLTSGDENSTEKKIFL